MHTFISSMYTTPIIHSALPTRLSTLSCSAISQNHHLARRSDFCGDASILINFAARGDPNGPGLSVWKAFDENSQTAMVFGDSSESRQLPNVKGLKAVDALLRCGRRNKVTGPPLSDQ